MEMIERKFEERTQKIEALMNFTEGAISNMKTNDDGVESDGEVNNPEEQSQINKNSNEVGSIEEVGGRVIKNQPLTAQRSVRC